jgi:hypothetical protein
MKALAAFACLVCLGGAALVGCASGPRPHPLPPGVTLDGRWDSNFHEMVLHQRGPKVWGTIAYRDGGIDGTLDGDVLRFRWHQRQNRQRGRGYLQLSPDGSRLEGRWGYDDSDDDGGRWWAERAEGGEGGEVTPSSSTEPQAAPASGD